MCRCDNERQAVVENPVYRFINRTLWILAALLPIFWFAKLPDLWDAREKTEIQETMQVAAESSRYCQRWGMAPATREHTDCLRDLTTIRIDTEQRLHERERSIF